MTELAERLHRLFPEDQLADFAQRWRIGQLSLFGSVLRDDFAANSDVDVLVSFEQAATWSMWDLTTMADELSSIVGRTVDLVEKPEAVNDPANTLACGSCEQPQPLGADPPQLVDRSTRRENEQHEFDETDQRQADGILGR